MEDAISSGIDAYDSTVCPRLVFVKQFHEMSLETTAYTPDHGNH